MKTWHIITTALIIIAFTGCAGDGGKPSAGSPFVGGTNGILMSFLEGNPPAEVTDGEQFPFKVVVKLKNDGEATIPAGWMKLSLSGIDPVEFSAKESDMSQPTGEEEKLIRTYKDVEGNTIEGGTAYISFPPNDDDSFNYKGSLSGNMPFTIRADACYRYGTMATSKLCLKRNVLEPDKEGVCKVTESKAVYNSGGPVQITSLQEGVGGRNRISFTFTVAHKGNGNMYQPEEIDRGYDYDWETLGCGRKEITLNADGESTIAYTENLLKKDKPLLIIDTGIKPGDNTKGLSCPGITEANDWSRSDVEDDLQTMFGAKPKGDADGMVVGYLPIYSGERTITCTQDIPDDLATESAETVINIYLIYDYLEDISTQVLVKHVSTE